MVSIYPDKQHNIYHMTYISDVFNTSSGARGSTIGTSVPFTYTIK
jgi:hypothetical protein